MAAPGVPLSQGDDITPQELDSLWCTMGMQKKVVAFYNGPNAGRIRCFSNAFEHRPFTFEIPESLMEFCPEMTSFDRNVTCAFAEKPIMLCKAVIMNDGRMFDEIEKTTNAAKANALGKKVNNWDEGLWRRMVCFVAFQIVYQKFSKLPELRTVLLQTGDYLIADACRTDCKWGIGLEHSNPKTQVPSEWRGSNILGWALCQARAQIRADQLAEKNALEAEAQPTRSIARPLNCDARDSRASQRPSMVGSTGQYQIVRSDTRHTELVVEARFVSGAITGRKQTFMWHPDEDAGVLERTQSGIDAGQTTISPPDHAAPTAPEVWEQFFHDDGSRRAWWYNDVTGEFFFEDDAGPWQRWLCDDDPHVTDPNQMRGWWSHSLEPDRWFLEPKQ